jgi:hypothetical protein
MQNGPFGKGRPLPPAQAALAEAAKLAEAEEAALAAVTHSLSGETQREAFF